MRQDIKTVYLSYWVGLFQQEKLNPTSWDDLLGFFSLQIAELGCDQSDMIQMELSRFNHSPDHYLACLRVSWDLMFETPGHSQLKMLEMTRLHNFQIDRNEHSP